ncbi:unnamed protein product [Sphagnum balticum]
MGSTHSSTPAPVLTLEYSLPPNTTFADQSTVTGQAQRDSKLLPKTGYVETSTEGIDNIWTNFLHGVKVRR